MGSLIAMAAWQPGPACFTRHITMEANVFHASHYNVPYKDGWCRVRMRLAQRRGSTICPSYLHRAAPLAATPQKHSLPASPVFDNPNMYRLTGTKVESPARLCKITRSQVCSVRDPEFNFLRDRHHWLPCPPTLHFTPSRQQKSGRCL